MLIKRFKFKFFLYLKILKILISNYIKNLIYQTLKFNK